MGVNPGDFSSKKNHSTLISICNLYLALIIYITRVSTPPETKIRLFLYFLFVLLNFFFIFALDFLIGQSTFNCILGTVSFE